MKSIKATLTILFFILFIGNSHAQDFTWKLGGNGIFTDNSNWEEAGFPNPGDNIIFNNVGTVLVTDIPETFSSLGDITITNNSYITIETSTAFDGITISCISIIIDATSSLTIEQIDKFIQLSFDSGEINGEIYLDGNEHKIMAYGSFNFNDIAVFEAGANLTGSPFGDGSMNSVQFLDNSTYRHIGGYSPFGNSTGNTTLFSSETNYYILENASANISDSILFSGQTYGNIIIGESGGTSVNINSVANTTGTGPYFFTFNTLTTENGSFFFAGNPEDQIIITSGIYANSEDIKFECNSFVFSGDTYIDNIDDAFDVTFILSSASNDNILAAASSLTLNGRLNVSCSTTKEMNIAGTINFETDVIALSNINLNLLQSAKLITANVGGIEGSIEGGSFTYDSFTTFEFNGSSPQNTGLIAHSSPVGTMIIDKISENLTMDANIQIDSLRIYNGDFQIGGKHLIISGGIEYGNGNLVGDATSSNLEIIESGAGSGDNIILNTGLTLYSLIIDRINGGVSLNAGGLITTSNTFIKSGYFDLGTSKLHTEHLLDLTGGELSINEGTLIINGSFSPNGGYLFGGEFASLKFLSNALAVDSLPMIELSEFYSEATSQIKMGGDLIIYNNMNLVSGSLLISEGTDYYNLTLNGNFESGGGLLAGTNTSSLIIGEGASATNMTLSFLDTHNSLNNLSVNRTGKIIDFNSDLNIGDLLDLTAGKIRFDFTTLNLADASLSNYSDTSYIITGSTGFVSRNIAVAEPFEFPIGTNLYYAPVSIGSQSSETFNVQVTDSVFQEGNGGNQIIDERLVNLTWNILHTDHTNPYNLNLTWDTDAEGLDLYQAEPYLSNYDINESKWLKVVGGNTNTATAQSLYVTGLDIQGLFSVSSIYNITPVAENQEFTIPEDSPTEMFVGRLIADDPDTDYGQTLSFIGREGHSNPDAFTLLEDGQIFIKNSELLEYSLHPTYDYIVNVCDDGNPIECAEFNVTINLTEVIVIEPEIPYSATNYISPNGDGKNDTWIVKGLESGTYNVAIFDNKGNIVFRSDDYMNDWNGTNGGNRLSPGVYFYSITKQDFVKKGTITLVR